jgi:hypothetical protein
MRSDSATLIRFVDDFDVFSAATAEARQQKTKNSFLTISSKHTSTLIRSTLTDPLQTLVLFKTMGHISFWNVSRVTNMETVFNFMGCSNGERTRLNKDLCCWNVDNVANMSSVFNVSAT